MGPMFTIRNTEMAVVVSTWMNYNLSQKGVASCSINNTSQNPRNHGVGRERSPSPFCRRWALLFALFFPLLRSMHACFIFALYVLFFFRITHLLSSTEIALALYVAFIIVTGPHHLLQAEKACWVIVLKCVLAFCRAKESLGGESGSTMKARIKIL